MLLIIILSIITKPVLPLSFFSGKCGLNYWTQLPQKYVRSFSKSVQSPYNKIVMNIIPVIKSVSEKRVVFSNC